MLINRKILVTLGLASAVTFVSLTSMAPDDHDFKNLKVLPKNLTHQQLGKVMHEWSQSLGVRCDFCHARDTTGKGLDFASDAKPEKDMARSMFKMMGDINEKYFEAKKDSLGMVMTAGVSCNTCHRGTPHPEAKLPEGGMRPGGPGGPPPGGGGLPTPGGAPGNPPPGGPGGPQKQ